MAFAGGIVFSVPSAPISFWDLPTSGPSGGFGETYQKNPWDTVFLGGIQMPGKCSVKALPTVHFDKKKPPGLDGLTITAQGYIPGPVDIEIVMWTEDQWTKWQNARTRIWTNPNRGGKILALDISHPATDDAKIKSVVIEGISLAEDGPVSGAKTIKIKAVQFLPATGKTKTHTVDRSNVGLDDRQNPGASKTAANSKGAKSPGENQTGPTGIAKKG